MKGFLIYFFRSVIFLIVLYFISIFLLAKWGGLTNRAGNLADFSGGYGHTICRLREFEKINNIDFLFLGSSKCYRTYDPRIFKNAGYDVFNLGTNAQTNIHTYYLLKDKLKSKTINVAFINLDFGLFSKNVTEPSLDLISNKTFNIYSLKIALKTISPMVLNSTIYQFFNQLFYPIEQKKQKQIAKNKYISGGYVESQYQSKSIEAISRIKPFAYSIKHNQIKYLKKTINFLEQNNIQVVLVHPPEPVEYINKTMNYDEFLNLVTKISEDYNIPFWDGNKMGEFTADEHFYDASHLNQNGVKLFNQLIINKINGFYNGSINIH